MVEEPAKPFQLPVAADAFQRLDLSLHLVDSASERVFRLAEAINRPFLGRQHCASRVLLGILRHAERLGKAEASEVINEAGVVCLPEQLDRFVLGSPEMYRAKGTDAFTEPEVTTGAACHVLIKTA